MYNCKSIHLFKITGMLKPENVKLNQNYICDTIEIGWKEVNVTFNGNKINLPKFVMIKFRDKFKIRHMKREPLLFHIILKQGFTWVLQHSRNCIRQYNYFLQSGIPPQGTLQLCLSLLSLCPTQRHS